VVLERFAGPGVEQGLHRLVHQPAAARPVLAVGGVFRRPVAQPEDGGEPPAAGQIQHGDVLGDAQGVVQREQHGRDRDADALRTSEDEAG
jgi:hypothetical protein